MRSWASALKLGVSARAESEAALCAAWHPIQMTDADIHLNLADLVAGEQMAAAWLIDSAGHAMLAEWITPQSWLSGRWPARWLKPSTSAPTSTCTSRRVSMTRSSKRTPTTSGVPTSCLKNCGRVLFRTPLKDEPPRMVQAAAWGWSSEGRCGSIARNVFAVGFHSSCSQPSRVFG